MSGRRVVITGLGCVTPLGMGEEEWWRRMLAGEGGIRPIRNLDVSACKCRNGAEVDDAALASLLQARGFQAGDRTVNMGLLAAAQVLEQAGLLPQGAPPEPRPVATIFGTGAGSAHSLMECFTAFSVRGVRGLRPSSVPRCMANALSSQISIRFRLTGPNYVIVSACTSSTTAIGIGFRMIRDGCAAQVLAGGSDAPFDPLVYGGWNNLGVMSPNSDPARACRPFDAARDGCILGEGAGALMMESLDEARRRGVRIRGEVVGFGESSDAEHITRPSEQGQAFAIRDALACAGIEPRDVGFVNAHGTGTRANDVCEARALRLALGAAADVVPVASNKSLFGHLLGAAGVVESLAVVKGLETGWVPPNLNLETADPDCSLRLVGGQAERVAARYAIKNNFGFGGNNAVLVFKRWEE